MEKRDKKADYELHYETDPIDKRREASKEYKK